MDASRLMVALIAILLISHIAPHESLDDSTAQSSTSARSCSGSTSVHSIEILPPGPVILSADEVQDFSFTLKDSSGNPISAGYDHGSTGGSTVMLGGEQFRFSPSGLGQASVWICSGNVNRTVTINVVIGTVVNLELTSDDVEVTADESVDLILERVDQQGYRQAIVVPTSNWTLPPGSSLELLPGGNFRWTPNQEGNQTLMVEDGEFVAEIEIVVSHGSARRLTISSSSSFSDVTADDALILESQWEDVRGNRWSANASWEIDGDISGLNSTIGSSVLFDASLEGLITILAEAEDPITPSIIRTASISFVVNPGRLISLEIAGHSSTIPVDVPFDLDPRGYDADGNSVDLSGLVWSIVEGESPESSINQLTYSFTPTVPGQHRIVATLGSRVTSATIEVEQGVPSFIEVRSDGDLALSVQTGLELNLSVKGFDLAGSSYPVDVEWTVPAGFGSIEASSAGTGSFVYLAEGVGTVEMIATIGNTSWSVLIGVIAGPPHSLEFDFIGELKQGKSVEVEVRAYDIANNKVSIAVCAVEFETTAGEMECVEGRWILDLKGEGELRLEGRYDDGYGLEYITIESTLMDGLFGSDAGAAIVGGVLILLMILGVLLAADRKTKEMIKERKMEEISPVTESISEEIVSAPPVAPAPAHIPYSPSSFPKNQSTGPLMSNELPIVEPISQPSESNVPANNIVRWTDEQLISSGWTREQVDLMRSQEKESKHEESESEEWDTGW